MYTAVSVGILWKATHNDSAAAMSENATASKPVAVMVDLLMQKAIHGEQRSAAIQAIALMLLYLTVDPSCLTMMPPAFTSCPPYTLTPLRLELESRPFLVEPAPFLCAASTLKTYLGTVGTKARLLRHCPATKLEFIALASIVASCYNCMAAPRKGHSCSTITQQPMAARRSTAGLVHLTT